MTVKRAKRWLNGARSIRQFLDQRRLEWGIHLQPRVCPFLQLLSPLWSPLVPRAECPSCGFLSKFKNKYKKVSPARFRWFSNFALIKLGFHYSIQHITQQYLILCDSYFFSICTYMFILIIHQPNHGSHVRSLLTLYMLFYYRYLPTCKFTSVSFLPTVISRAN